MKFFFADSKHNFFHYLIVVLTKIVQALFFLPLGIYLTAFGLSFSADTISYFFPEIWWENITFYSNLLPYFEKMNEAIFRQLNHWYREAPVWWGMVVGIPLTLLGIDLFLIYLFNLLHAVLSPEYNHTHCPFCQKAIKVKLNGTF